MSQQISGVTADGNRVDILVDKDGRIIVSGADDGEGNSTLTVLQAILAELEAQRAILETIASNTAPTP